MGAMMYRNNRCITSGRIRLRLRIQLLVELVTLPDELRPWKIKMKNAYHRRESP